MASIQEFAINLLLNSPKVKDNPLAQQYLQVIMNGQSEEGARIAENLCQTYGISKEDAVSKAKVFFNLK